MKANERLEQVLNENATKHMVEWNYSQFKRDSPHLYLVIIEAMKVYAREACEERLKQFTKYCDLKQGLFIPSWMIDNFLKLPEGLE